MSQAIQVKFDLVNIQFDELMGKARNYNYNKTKVDLVRQIKHRIVAFRQYKRVEASNQTLENIVNEIHDLNGKLKSQIF